jgi:hypothetical protein
MLRRVFLGSMFSAYLVFILCLFYISGISAQESAKISPHSKTDTYAVTDSGHKIRVQHGELAKGNFQIAGVDLASEEEVLNQAVSSLGKVATHHSGDASTALREACYQATENGDSTILIIQRGEVSPSFVLAANRSYWKWKTPCMKTMKVNRKIATASGLRIGLSQEQVIGILGLPTRRSHNPKAFRDSMTYEFETRKKTDRESLLRARRQNPGMPDYEIEENYGYYDLGESIKTEFVNDSLVAIEVVWSATT